MRMINKWKYACRYLLKWKLLSRPWILGRHACLGDDILKLLGNIAPVFNIQKGRVDYLLDVVADRNRRARFLDVDPYMARKDIVPLIAQEEYFLWSPDCSPQLVFIDSYSELTDQLFVHKANKWKFCCNYSDLNHSGNFSRMYESAGLLPIEDIEKHYNNFFMFIRKQYVDVPILFLHFPIKLDKRDKFKQRYESILAIITKLAKNYAPFYSIAIDENIVDWPEEKIPGLENFPYHYNKATYAAFAGEIRKIGALEDLWRNR